MAKQIIAVDIDDVLAPSAQSFIAFSNETWGTSLTIDDYSEDWTRLWQVDHEEAMKRSDVVHSSAFWHQEPRQDDAQRVLRKLAGQYRLVVTTSRRSQLKQHTLVWIEKHFGDIFENVHFAGMWDIITADSIHATKKELCEQIGASFLIDDQPKHCLAVAKAGITALMFGDYPWNRMDNLPEGVIRVHDWRAVEEYFDGLTA